MKSGPTDRHERATRTAGNALRWIPISFQSKLQKQSHDNQSWTARTAWVREGVCTDIDKKNDLHEDASTTKIIKKTLVSVPQDCMAKQRSGELRHEGQGGQRVAEHEGRRLCELDPVEGGAGIHGDQPRRDRKVTSPLHQRVAIDCVRKLEGSPLHRQQGHNVRQYTHKHCTCSAAHSFSQARNASHALGSELNNIFVRLKRVCQSGPHMSRPLLLSHLPCTTSTSASSFTLPSSTTPEHAL